MASSDVQRKLTAILCADVVGFSCSKMKDEEATVEGITAKRKVFPSWVEQFRSRVGNAPGDSNLAGSPTWWIRLTVRWKFSATLFTSGCWA